MHDTTLRAIQTKVDNSTMVITPSEKLAQWLRHQSLDAYDFGGLPHILSYQHWIILCLRQHMNDTRIVLTAFEMLDVLTDLYKKRFEHATTLEAWQAAQDFQRFWMDGHVYALTKHLESYAPSELMIKLQSSYRAHLMANNLLDMSTIWSVCTTYLSETTSVDGMPPIIFYGFHQMTPQMEMHVQALARHTICRFHYATQPHQTTEKIIATDADEEKQHVAQWLENWNSGRVTLLVHAPDEIHRWHDHLCRHFRHTSKCIVKQDLQALTTFKPIAMAFNTFRLCDDIMMDFDQPWLTAYVARLSASRPLFQPLAVFLATYGANRIHKDVITSWLQLHGHTNIQTWWQCIQSHTVNKPAQQSRAQWCFWMHAYLKDLGWPFVQHVDSKTHQVIHRFITALQTWSNRMSSTQQDLSFDEALFELEHFINTIVFQPQQIQKADIEITTPNQYQGQTTDVLIVTGTTTQHFPQHAAIHSALHQHRPTPNAIWHPRQMVLQCQQIRQSWQHNATKIVYTAPMCIDQSAQEPAYFLNNIPLTEPIEKSRHGVHSVQKPQHIFADLKLTKKPYAGSINQITIKNQSHCSMKAFWQHHTHLTSNLPKSGDDIKRLRGIVCHQVMAHFWSDCDGNTALHTMTDTQIEGLLSKHISTAMAQTYALIPWFAQPMVLEIETEEILSLLKSFVLCERETEPFKVVATELADTIEIGQHRLNIRYDRVDQTAHGLRVMDFKTGHAHPEHWLGDRPEDPQMLIYLQSQRKFVSADYGLIRGQGGQVLNGHAFIAKQAAHASWSDFVAQSKKNLEQLIEAFMVSDARQNPKGGPEMCRVCDYKRLCRMTDREVLHDAEHV